MKALARVKEAQVTVVVLESAKHRELTIAGIIALNKWTFAPQLWGDDPVDGELTVRIHSSPIDTSRQASRKGSLADEHSLLRAATFVRQKPIWNRMPEGCRPKIAAPRPTYSVIPTGELTSACDNIPSVP